MPSSRLTRILQEKAEALRKRRQSAEAESEKAEAFLRQLEGIDIQLPEAAARRARVAEAERRSDWDAAENEARELLHYAEGAAPAALDTRRTALIERLEALRASGQGDPAEMAARAASARALQFGTDLGAEVATLAELVGLARRIETEFTQAAQGRVVAVARWVGVPEAEWPEVERKIGELVTHLDGGHTPDAIGRLQSAVLEILPSAPELRERTRRSAEGIVGLAREIGLDTPALDAALATDAGTQPTGWPDSVPAIDRAMEGLEGELRARVLQSISYLATTLGALREQGADPSEPLAELGRLQTQAEACRAAELEPLIREARRIAEEPVVSVVAGLLDEVRPRLVEARELGRDTSAVFASMNRAREALRLKVYGEALAAGVEAIDRAGQLTADLDAVRDEADGLGRLIARVEPLKVATPAFRNSLGEVNALIDRYDVEGARTLLRQTIRSLGRESAQHFTSELERLRAASNLARQREFLPAEVPSDLEEGAQLLEAGSVADAGERLARADVALRGAAGPYVARRVEEMRQAFAEVDDSGSSLATLRSLADADIALRVKEDVGKSLECLRQAEREFSTVFAAESSSLLEQLEERSKVLEEMGGAGTEFLHQVDEIQQIFDMGDFIRCARSAREFLAGTESVQRNRAEEALSHAKLALVELERIEALPDELKHQFDAALQETAAGHLVEGYRTAVEVGAGASRIREAARQAAEEIARAKERLLELERAGVDAMLFQGTLGQADQALRAHDFPGARATARGLVEKLAEAASEAEVRSVIEEASLLVADATKLGVPVEEIEGKLVEARGLLEGGSHADALARARQGHQRVIETLRPVLEENLRGVEEDYEIARNSGVDVGPVSATLADARRRFAQPVPFGVAERVEGARAQLSETRGFVEHAERGTKRVEEAYGQAELLGVATPEMRTRVDALEQALRDRRFARAVEISGPLEREILAATTQHIQRTLAGLQGLLNRARQDGVPTAASEEILAQAKAALQSGQRMEAIQLAAQSEAEVERVGLQSRVALGAIEALESKLARFEEDHIRVARASQIAAEARAAFERKEFVASLEVSLEAGELLTTAREQSRKARDALEIADRQVREALGMGADAAEAQSMLVTAREIAASGEYGPAAIRAREAADLAWGSIERRYSGSLAKSRELIALATVHELSAVGPASEALQGAETSFQAKSWSAAGEALERAQGIAAEALDREIVARIGRATSRWAELGTPDRGEADRRQRWETELAETRATRSYSAAFELLDREERRGRDTQRSELERRVAELKDRLWVGERLGLDTTPAMERFSEARMALDRGRLEVVARELELGNASLESLVRSGLARRTEEVRTEFHFARDGLHVQLGDLDGRLASIDGLVAAGQLVEAGRNLLAVEEELGRRKSFHREIQNLHYLIEAGLRRAAASHLDAGEARRLFDESVRESTRDYPIAVEKARASLKLVESLLKSSEPSTAFWPFRRPLDTGPGAPP